MALQLRKILLAGYVATNLIPGFQNVLKTRIYSLRFVNFLKKQIKNKICIFYVATEYWIKYTIYLWKQNNFRFEILTKEKQKERNSWLR